MARSSITDGGVDYTFECVGDVNAMRQFDHDIWRDAVRPVLVETERAYEWDLISSINHA